MTFDTISTIKKLQVDGCAGNRWFCVNLHVHGEGNDPSDLIQKARAAEIDLIAITDHQSFAYIDKIQAAANTPGRQITVLPGIEITAEEGPHILAVFPTAFAGSRRTEFLGYLELDGEGRTNISSKRSVKDIFSKVEEWGGIIVVPHPLTDDIGLLAPARKMNIKEEWLDSGHVHLMQIDPSRVKYIPHDDNGNWINRYVLSSSRPQDIDKSSYCLAPLNRSDSHKAKDIAEGLSWLRMSSPSIEGLKQVACEPHTRISRSKPLTPSHLSILCVFVAGGYCDGQRFDFNRGLNVFVGANHAGKSAALDFIRFALSDDIRLGPSERSQFYDRLNAILQADGTIEVIAQIDDAYYVIRRTFKPVYDLKASPPLVQSVTEAASAYQYDQDTESLVPADGFQLPIEVYEQGRIHRLREDLTRQLDMLDEFAGLTSQRALRADLIRQLEQSATQLKPLREEREQLRSDVSTLASLKQDLAAKTKLLPGEDQTKWTTAANLVQSIRTVSDKISVPGAQLEKLIANKRSAPRNDLAALFGQEVPDFPATEIAERNVLQGWHDDLKATVARLDELARDAAAVIKNYASRADTARRSWEQAYAVQAKLVADTLRAANIESPRELLSQIEALRAQVNEIENIKTTRLTELTAQISIAETERVQLLRRLSDLEAELSEKRAAKAKELSASLDGQIRIDVQVGGDRREFIDTLAELCAAVSGAGRKVQSRDAQLKLVTDNIRPRELAEALANNGALTYPDGSTKTLVQLCHITENTQSVLCGIAADIQKLNKLQIVHVSETLHIFVKRHGENKFADLNRGLSQGEQSAAILTMALQTRVMPLLIDQPEDELGYSYVVHRIVPKILNSKGSRQLIIVTHNANIPVLGDADYVMQMQNEPIEGGRRCFVQSKGCFESPDITDALIALEGGREAFRFRQHRYSLPRSQAAKLEFRGEVS